MLNVGPHLEDVAPGVVLEAPAEPGEHLDDVLGREHGEQAVEEDLEPDGQRLAAVQGEAGHVEHRVGQGGLHGGGRVAQE